MAPPSLPSPIALDAAHRFAGQLRSRWGESIVAVRLFGSFARGEAHEGSDVDVAVVIRELDWQTKREILDLAADIGFELGVALSATIIAVEEYRRHRDQERPLVMDIESQGLAV